jgi:cell division transport system permease protein
MTWLRTLLYFIQEAFLDFRRNTALYGFACFVMTLSLFVLGFSRYLTGNVNTILKTWERDLEVRVFLADEVPRDQVLALQKEMAKDPSVASVEFVSPEEALKVLERLAPAFRGTGIAQGDSPLPPSISLRLKTPLDLDRVRALVVRVGKLPGVAQVLFDWDWVDRLRSYTRFAEFLGWVLFGALGIAAVFTVAAICRIIALNRREEIAILHFVGATGASVRGPFVVGGMLMGAFAAAGALLAVVAAHLLLHRSAGSDTLLLGWVSRGFLDLGDQALLLGAGVVLGGLGGLTGLGSIERWTH